MLLFQRPFLNTKFVAVLFGDLQLFLFFFVFAPERRHQLVTLVEAVFQRVVLLLEVDQFFLCPVPHFICEGQVFGHRLAIS